MPKPCLLRIIFVVCGVCGCTGGERATVPTPSRAEQLRTPVRTDCSMQAPCTLGAVLSARERVVSEKRFAARASNVVADEHNINVMDKFTEEIRRWVLKERQYFSDWCSIEIQMKEALTKLGSTLSSETMYQDTGQPDEETRLDQPTIEGKVWAWNVAGPFSGAVIFSVLFVRPAGSAGPWSFNGCTWCASGTQAVEAGCVSLPWKP